jgi:hypothetical protein
MCWSCGGSAVTRGEKRRSGSVKQTGVGGRRLLRQKTEREGEESPARSIPAWGVEPAPFDFRPPAGQRRPPPNSSSASRTSSTRPALPLWRGGPEGDRRPPAPNLQQLRHAPLAPPSVPPNDEPPPNGPPGWRPTARPRVVATRPRAPSHLRERLALRLPTRAPDPASGGAGQPFLLRPPGASRARPVARPTRSRRGPRSSGRRAPGRAGLPVERAVCIARAHASSASAPPAPPPTTGRPLAAPVPKGNPPRTRSRSSSGRPRPTRENPKKSADPPTPTGAGRRS